MSRGCWTDKDDMPRRQGACAPSSRVRFERGGRLMGDPQLIDPPRQPAADRPMPGVHPAGAGGQLRQCETLPRCHREYYGEFRPYIDLTFVAVKADRIRSPNQTPGPELKRVEPMHAFQGSLRRRRDLSSAVLRIGFPPSKAPRSRG